MHIVCCLKQVPDTADVRIDPETNTLMREGVESILNPYDLVAVEQALRIRDRYGGSVSAVSMGPPQSASVLREALSRGADRVFLLSDRAFAGADTLATSYTLACAIRRLDREDPVQLVICGKQAIDGDTAQTGPGVATRLGYTLFTYVEEIQELDPGQQSIKVARRVDEGREVLVGRLPALITAEMELAKPRRASLPDSIAALRAQIPVWNGRDIEADPGSLGIKGSPTWVRRIESPPAKESGPTFNAASGVQEAVSQALDTLFEDTDEVRKLVSAVRE
jgi:electron transfer flavoprotein beta subunit